MAYITSQQVQQWLNQTKLTISEVDAELESTAQLIVFAAISTEYTTTTWVDASTTPQLIQRVISMFVAAWTYIRALSDEEGIDPDFWGARLEAMANKLLEQIADGSLTIPGADPVLNIAGYPSFYPTDDQIDDDAAKFTMGVTF